MLTPRLYQEEAIKSIFRYFERYTGNPLLAMPTGTGKSLVIAEFLKRALAMYSGQRIMMLTHVKELIEQNHAEFLSQWSSAPVGIYSAGLNKKQSHFPITFAGIGSVCKKATIFGHIDLIIVDEAHRLNPKQTTMYAKFILDLKVANPKLKVIGLTATPYRLGSGRLTECGIFTDICYDITTTEAFVYLIANNFLAPLTIKRPNFELEVEGVKLSNTGEYNLKDLQFTVDKEVVTREAVAELVKARKQEGREHVLVFGTGIEHCENIVDALELMGETACIVHSKLTKKQRKENIDGFKSGKYTYAVNNNVLTTGFNFKPIDLIAVLRPTQSASLWVQMLGRGTRPFPGKINCLVMDFAGNTRRLGPINNPVIPQRKGKKVGGQAPVKVCPHCNMYNHASVKECSYCAEEFVFETKIRSTMYAEEVMTTDLPVVVNKKIDKIVYAIKKKLGRKDSLQVTYYCNLRS